MMGRMRQIGRGVAFAIALTLLAFGGVTFARASLAAVENATGGVYVPSAIPALLGPIGEFGRDAWNCLPEHAAKATKASDAALPTEDGR